jgi:uncharacterized protein (TIGR02099 family)
MTSLGFWPVVRNAVIKVLAFWILLFAAYLALGRQFIPYVEKLEPQLEQWLSSQLDTEVEVGAIEGSWLKFNPVITLRDVQLGDALFIEELVLAPGFYESIVRGGLSFIRFDLRGLDADLMQSDLGWQIRGLARAESSRSALSSLRFILQLFQRQQHVSFQNVQLHIVPLDFPEFDVLLEKGRLAGGQLINSLVATATLSQDDLTVPVELQLETTLEAGQLNHLYIQHGAVELSPWLAELDPSISGFLMTGEYWLNFDRYRWRSAAAKIGIERVQIAGRAEPLLFEQLDMAISASHSSSKTSGTVSLYSDGNTDAPIKTNALFSLVGEKLDLQWDALPAELVGQWLAKDDDSGFWRRISPKGFVENGQLQVDTKVLDSLTLNADLVELSISPSKDVPGLDRLSGRLSMTRQGGEIRFESDETTLNLTSLYDQPFTAEVSQGVLSWQRRDAYGSFIDGSADVVLAPGLLNSEQAEATAVNVSWHSRLPNALNREAGREKTIEVALTAPYVDADWMKYLAQNHHVKPGISNEIERIIQAGTFTDVKLDFIAAFGLQSKPDRQFFLSAQAVDVGIHYLEGWPAVEQFNGTVTLGHNRLQVSSARPALMSEMSFSDIDLNIDFESSLMTVAVVSELPAAHVVRFLKQDPVRALLAGRLDDLYAEDSLGFALNLKVPLTSPEAFQLETDIDFHGNSLEFADLNLIFNDVQGGLSFSSDDGLSSTDLSAVHRGELQHIEISGQPSSEQNSLQISIEGHTPLKFWGMRYGDPLFMSSEARVAHQTTVSISDEATEIEVYSDMVGFELALPEPLSKSAEQAVPMKLNIKIDSKGRKYFNSQIDDDLKIFTEFSADNQLKRGTLAYREPLKVRDEPGLYFDFNIDEVSIDAWWAAIQAYAERLQVKGGSGSGRFSEQISEINLVSDKVWYLAKEWHQASIQLYQNEQGWIAGFSADEGQGQISIPSNGVAMFADFQWLNINTDQTSESGLPVDPLESRLPDEIPEMSIQVNNLIWNGKDLGSWRASLRSSNGELVAEDLEGQMDGAELKGELFWRIVNGKHRSQFTGQIAIGNVQNILQTWSQPELLVTRDGEVDFDLSWAGSPAFFNYRSLQGVVDIELKDGAIIDVGELEGVKLVGLLNLSRIIERVALDFSDLLGDGISFDTLDGEILFDRGFARVGKQLVIDGASTTFRFTGDADLLTEQLDVDLNLTVPLSKTFPLVALLAGVSPQAAAAIYVTELALNDELSQISSARMHIIGSFDSPEVLFYKVSSAEESQ